MTDLVAVSDVDEGVLEGATLMTYSLVGGQQAGIGDIDERPEDEKISYI